ncbi:MAG TPA: glycoside hydrolase family 30 beta sandwich domain-containing protein, partial [Polyangia bacterium]
SGGSSANPTGGSSASPSGGVSPNPGGGSSANPSGGTSANPGGGSSANPTGGTSANPGGGSSAKPGGASAGGSAAGGGQAGSTQGSAGSTASGGSATASTALVTSANGSYWKTATWTEAASGTADVTVNDTAAQTWDGFGGAFNEKGWSYLTTKAMQDQAIQLLFGADGAHFAWGRIPIGASDYAIDRYSLDETANDTTMASFSITRDQQKLIPYIKAAQAVKSDIRFWASPWSPPTWMKTGPYNPNTGKSNSNFDGGVMKSDDATLKAFALYLVKFVQAYAAEGIKIEIVSAQNEPNYQQNYPSCHWETATYVKFLGSYLGPAITSASLTTKIMDGTLSNPSGDADIGSSVLKDATAKPFIGAIGVQWGMAASSQVTTLKNAAGGVPIWLSETQCGGTTGSTAPAPNDFAYGVATWGYIRDAVKNGLTAYNAWNMVLDKGGLGIDDTRKWPQNALLVADSGAITQTPAYYVFRHFSQFVEPGAKVLGTSGSSEAVAFKNPDGSIVAVVYSSSAKSSYIVSIAGKKLQFSLPVGWATIKYKG